MTQRVGKKNKNYLLNTLLIIFKIYVLSEPLTYIEAVKFIEYNWGLYFNLFQQIVTKFCGTVDIVYSGKLEFPLYCGLYFFAFLFGFLLFLFRVLYYLIFIFVSILSNRCLSVCFMEYFLFNTSINHFLLVVQ